MCSANNRSGGDPLHGNPFQCHHVLTQPRDIPNCLSGANALGEPKLTPVLCAPDMEGFASE